MKNLTQHNPNSPHLTLNSPLTPLLGREGNHDGFGVNFSTEEQNVINSRIGLACQLFMHYCYDTGYDPKYGIQEIIKEFKMWFTYEMVENVFMEDIKKGVVMRIGVIEPKK